MSIKLVVFSVTFIFLSGICSVNAVAENAPRASASLRDPTTFGEMNVGHSTFTAVDAKRGGRSMLVDVWYPVDEKDAIFELLVSWSPKPRAYPKTQYPLFGPFGIEAAIARDQIADVIEWQTFWQVSAQKWRKLIVFSHGYGGINTQSTLLMETLASHGFIVVAPEHTGNSSSGPQDAYVVAAANRVPDISFIIDTMIKRSADPADNFYRRINSYRVGVVGHSFGGTTALGSVAGFAGAKPDLRVKAIAPISAVVVNSFTEEQLANIKVPVLLLGGTEDRSVPIQNNAFAFDLIPGKAPVYRADIIGAGHTHFANVCAIGNWLLTKGFGINQWAGLGAGALLGPYDETCSATAFPSAEALRLQNLYTVAFFKKHLLYNSRYSQYLTPSYSQVNETAVIFDKKYVESQREN